MPLLVGIATVAASSFAASAVVGAVSLGPIMSAVVGVAVGAMVGAVVGAVGAGITGGDIGAGAKWGAFAGAVSGGITGYFTGANAMKAASAGSESSFIDAGGGLEHTSPNAFMDKAGGSGSESWYGKLFDKVAGGGGAEGGSSSLAEKLILTGTSAAGSVGDYMSSQDAIKANQEMADKASEDNAEAQRQAFANRMMEINQGHHNNMAAADALHKNKMEEIAAGQDHGLEIAKLNNAAAMDQLNRRIGADADAVTAANNREDQKQADYNNSIINTDNNLFQRPMLSYASDMQGEISGFEESTEFAGDETGQAGLLQDPEQLKKQQMVG